MWIMEDNLIMDILGNEIISNVIEKLSKTVQKNGVSILQSQKLSKSKKINTDSEYRKVFLKCSDCGYTCVNTNELRHHMLEHVQIDCLNNREANLIGHTNDSSNCKLYIEMNTTSSSTNEGLIYNFIDCNNVSPEMEDHSVITNKSLTSKLVPSDNTKWKLQTNPANSIQKIYRCTICGYTSEYQRTIKAHVWKHSGHKNVDYPMFEYTTVNSELVSNTNSVPLKEKSSSVLKTIAENGQEFPYKEETQLKETTVNKNSNEYSILLKLLQNLPDRKTIVENSSDNQLTTNVSTVCNLNNSYTSLNNGEVFAQNLEMKNGKHALEEIEPDSKKKLHTSIHGSGESSKSFFKTSKNTSNFRNSKLLETLLGFQNTSSKSTYLPEKVTNVKIESFTSQEVPSKNLDHCPKLGISSSLLSVVELFHKDSTMEEEAKEKDAKNISKPKIKRSSKLIKDDVSVEKMDQVEILEQPAGFYRCKLCHYISSVKGHMCLHMRVHKSKQPFECPLCDFLGDCQLSLQEHSIQHCKLRQYHCKYCSSVFNYKSQLRTHSHIHEQHQLQQLLALPEYPQDGCNITNEERNLSKRECTDKMEFNLSKNLLNIKNDKLLKCDQCDFLALSSRSLKSHMKRHINDQRYLHQPLEQYKCCLCGYVCHYLSSMKSHMWRHAGNENYSYTITQEVPVINTGLDEDSSDSQEKGYSLVQKLSQQFGQSLIIFCCHECGFESANQAILTEHLRIKHYQAILIQSSDFVKA